MFVTYLLAVFTLAAAYGKEPPAVVAAFFTQEDCLQAKAVLKSEVEQRKLDVGVACLKVERSDL